MTVVCPEGHHNPPGFGLCAECGMPIEETDAESTSWFRAKWALIGASAVFALVVLAASVVLAIDRFDGSEEAAVSPVNREAIPQWWESAHTSVTELQQSISRARRSLERMDSAGLEKACQEMHDFAAVDVHNHLPAPVPELTSELTAAVEDAHAAAHMCLSLAAGSQNTYNGEFQAGLDQADRRLVHAQELVNDALLRDR